MINYVQSQMSSNKKSPSSKADVIEQGSGKVTDCEIKYSLIIKDRNNELTAKYPTLEEVLLGNNPIPFSPIPALNDPDDFAEKTVVTGLINQRVKDKMEREKATVTAKAMLLGWFHQSLEDYIQSEAGVNTDHKTGRRS